MPAVACEELETPEKVAWAQALVTKTPRALVPIIKEAIQKAFQEIYEQASGWMRKLPDFKMGFLKEHSFQILERVLIEHLETKGCSVVATPQKISQDKKDSSGAVREGNSCHVGLVDANSRQ